MLSPHSLRTISGSTTRAYHNLRRSYATSTNMATAYQIQVPTTNSGLLKFEHNKEEADKVSELLQKDLKNHHVFFNTSGFHNHIVHHLCTLYGTGGKSGDYVKAYDQNSGYQIKAMHPSEKTVEEFEQKWETASKFLGQGRSYANFLRYYQHEIEKKGWQDVVKEYLFAGDERANDLFARLYAGFLHPMIQLMYGIEFEQPAIIAAGLANASVHQNRLGEFLTKAEDAANKRNPNTGTLAELFESVHKHEKLAKSAHWEDPNRIYDGIMVRAPDEAVEFLGQVKVREDELEERTAEMIHTAAYVALGAAFHPPHIPKVDFFLMHHINAIPFIVCINKYPWVPTAMKVRLLEWKIRLDLIQYIARGSPPLQAAEIQNYTPREKNLVSKPEDLLPRFHAIPDDGHTIKLVRALLIAQDMSKKYADRPWIRIKNDDMWLKMHYMILDGNEKIDPKWVRSAGFEEAWNEIPKAK